MKKRIINMRDDFRKESYGYEEYYSQKEEQFRNTETVPVSTEKEQLDTKPQYSEIWYS
mgnify:CR=1 FL=1|jgi:hypothetical protein